MSKPREYRLRDAIELVAKHGFIYTCISSNDEDDNPMVHILQDWTPRGKEMAVFARSRGKYPGCRNSWAYRDDPSVS